MCHICIHHKPHNITLSILLKRAWCILKDDLFSTFAKYLHSLPKKKIWISISCYFSSAWKLSSTDVQICWQKYSLTFFSSENVFICLHFEEKFHSIFNANLTVYWPLLFLMRSLWYISSIFYGANWVSGTKFRETTSSQKVSKEETVICKSEEGRETTKIVEQRPLKPSFIVKQFNWWQLHIQKTIIQSLLKLSERQIKKIYSIGSVAFGWLFPFTPLC